MFKYLTLVLALYSNSSYGWECNGENKGSETKFERHVELATNIYFGKITTGYLAKDHKVVFELLVSDVLKGRYKSTVTLTTSDGILYPSITIGQNYIIFLYGDNRIDFCGVTIELNHISTIEKLNSHVETDGYFDEYTAKDLRYLLNESKQNP